MNMTTEWFSSARLGERYCRIKTDGRPDVYVFPKNMSNTYALCAVHYGSVDRSYCFEGGEPVVLPDGIAHFLEHKMFTQPDGTDAFDRFSALGADANAYTAYDRTVYLFNCTSDFDKSFATLLDMVTHPYFTAQSVKKEQGIIAQEIGMYDDDPDSVCYINMLRALYPNHPLSTNVCGTVKSIARITPELLYDCHRVFYNPSNMVIIVCGAVDEKRVAELVEQNYSPTGVLSFRRCVPRDNDSPAQKSITQCMQVAMPLFVMGFKERQTDADPVTRQRRDVLASILERMLFSTSGTLYNNLYDAGMITSPLSCGRLAEEDYAYTELCGSAKDANAVCEYIISHINNIRKSGLSKDDFVRCKRKRLGDAISRFDSTEEIANSLIGYAFDGLDILDDINVIQSVTFDELCGLFETMYLEQDTAVSFVLPTVK